MCGTGTSIPHHVTYRDRDAAQFFLRRSDTKGSSAWNKHFVFFKAHVCAFASFGIRQWQSTCSSKARDLNARHGKPEPQPRSSGHQPEHSPRRRPSQSGVGAAARRALAGGGAGRRRLEVGATGLAWAMTAAAVRRAEPPTPQCTHAQDSGLSRRPSPAGRAARPPPVCSREPEKKT
jgi:hypothetical protein